MTSTCPRQPVYMLLRCPGCGWDSQTAGPKRAYEHMVGSVRSVESAPQCVCVCCVFIEAPPFAEMIALCGGAYYQASVFLCSCVIVRVLSAEAETAQQQS